MDLTKVTDQDIRMFLLDRDASDNPVDLDVSFTEEEILSARKNAIRHYNSLAPVGVDYAYDFIPDAHIYLLGISYYLYLSRLANLTRNNVEFNAGGMTASTTKTRIQLYAEMKNMFKEEFERAAIARKDNLNTGSFYGRVG